MGTQKNIIYRLVLTNTSFGPYLPLSIFLGQKRGAAPQVPICVWGLKTPPKIWPTGWTFWVTCYLEIMFSTFLTPPPPPPPLKPMLIYNSFSLHRNILRIYPDMYEGLISFNIHWRSKDQFLLNVFKLCLKWTLKGSILRVFSYERTWYTLYTTIFRLRRTHASRANSGIQRISRAY